MEPIIKPESINILCGTMQTQSKINESPVSEKKLNQFGWNKFKTIVIEVCEVIKPIVDIIVSFCKSLSTVIGAYGLYCKYSRGKGGKDYATC